MKRKDLNCHADSHVALATTSDHIPYRKGSKRPIRMLLQQQRQITFLTETVHSGVFDSTTQNIKDGVCQSVWYSNHTLFQIWYIYDIFLSTSMLKCDVEGKCKNMGKEVTD